MADEKAEKAPPKKDDDATVPVTDAPPVSAVTVRPISPTDCKAD